MNKKDFSLMNDTAILKEIGERIEKTRIDNQLQDQDLSKEGIPLSTLQRAKKGGNINLVTFIKILRGLNRLHEFEALLQTSEISPVDLIRKTKAIKPKHRIKKNTVPNKQNPWVWSEK